MKVLLLPTIAFLLAVPAAGQETKPLPVDAYGRTVDVRGQFHQILENALGSAVGADFALASLEGTEVWPRYLRTAEPEVFCSNEYRKSHPDQSVEQYEAFRATEAGTAAGNECFQKLLATGPEGPALVEAHLATFELALAVPFFQALGSPAELDPSPEMRGRIQQILTSLIAFNRCLSTESYKKVGLEKMLREPQSLYATLDVVAEGACKPLADMLPH